MTQNISKFKLFLLNETQKLYEINAHLCKISWLHWFITHDATSWRIWPHTNTVEALSKTTYYTTDVSTFRRLFTEWKSDHYLRHGQKHEKPTPAKHVWTNTKCRQMGILMDGQADRQILSPSQVFHKCPFCQDVLKFFSVLAYDKPFDLCQKNVELIDNQRNPSIHPIFITRWDILLLFMSRTHDHSQFKPCSLQDRYD